MDFFIFRHARIALWAVGLSVVLAGAAFGDAWIRLDNGQYQHLTTVCKHGARSGYQ